MKQSKRKKKRTKASSGKGNSANEKNEKGMKKLLEAFAEFSVEDSNKAVASVASEDQSSSSGNFEVGSSSSSNGNFEVGSSSSSNSNVSMLFGDRSDLLKDGVKQKTRPKYKKFVATAGCVSSVLGKDYVRSVPKKCSSKLKGFHEESWREKAEEFLCSVLGEDCELGLAVVSDVLCQCGYNVNKGLDVLLGMLASSKQQAIDYYESTSKEDAQHTVESNNNLSDRTSDSTSNSSDIELQENMWFTGNLYRNLFQPNKFHHSTKTRDLETELPQKVLESLFNMPTPKNAEHEPSTMNWRNVVKKMTSLGPMSEPSNNQQDPLIRANGDEYLVHREAAQQHWASMKSCYQRAATAFANGEKGHAAHLSEQGKLQSKLAQEADQRASQDIFAARNKSIKNMITIDLHGQHIKQAMKLLKLHLLFGAYVRSVRSFRVITGCGSHGVGRSKLKNSVINLLRKEGISWSEENRGTLLIRLEGQTNFSFLDSGTGSDSEGD